MLLWKTDPWMLGNELGVAFAGVRCALPEGRLQPMVSGSNGT